MRRKVLKPFQAGVASTAAAAAGSVVSRIVDQSIDLLKFEPFVVIDISVRLRRRQNLRHTVQRQEAAPDRGCGVRHSVYMYLAARLELPACARWQAARHAKSAARGVPRRRQARWHLRCVLRRGKRKRRLPVAMTSSAPTVIRDGVLVGSQQGTRAARAGVPGPECRGGGGRGRACAAGVRGVV